MGARGSISSSVLLSPRRRLFPGTGVIFTSIMSYLLFIYPHTIRKPTMGEPFAVLLEQTVNLGRHRRQRRRPALNNDDDDSVDDIDINSITLTAANTNNPIPFPIYPAAHSAARATPAVGSCTN